MNPYLVLILTLWVAGAAVDTLADSLNLKNLRPELPGEFQGVYDPAKYGESQNYLRTNTRFAMIHRWINTAVMIAFVLLGGFNAVDLTARGIASGPVTAGLVFGALLVLLRTLFQLPFSLYETFVIEERFGFNRTTPGTFFGDQLKGLLVGAVLGLPLFAAIIYFFERSGSAGWLYAWAVFTLFYLVMGFLAPVVLLPLFNKFEPLPEGPLKEAILAYARTQNFQLSGIYTMDSSKRSTKSNAFFTGFGRFRRLVLFDTLIERQTTEELVAVLAHEIGHFKLRHIPKSTALAILSTGALLFVLSRFLNNPELFAAFRMENISVYASLVFAGLLYAPFSRLFALFTQALSRKFEYEADEFAARTYGRPELLISALKKLSVDNLSNLLPHPLKVRLEYTHPPILERIQALRARVLRV